MRRRLIARGNFMPGQMVLIGSDDYFSVMNSIINEGESSTKLNVKKRKQIPNEINDSDISLKQAELEEIRIREYLRLEIGHQ